MSASTRLVRLLPVLVVACLLAGNCATSADMSCSHSDSHEHETSSCDCLCCDTGISLIGPLPLNFVVLAPVPSLCEQGREYVIAANGHPIELFKPPER